MSALPFDVVVAVLAIPVSTAALLALLPNYRLTARLNVLAAERAVLDKRAAEIGARLSRQRPFRLARHVRPGNRLAHRRPAAKTNQRPLGNLGPALTTLHGRQSMSQSRA